MKKRRRLKRALKISFALFVMLFANFLYAVLSSNGAEASLMYRTAHSHLMLNAASAGCVSFVLLLFRERGGEEEELFEESEQYEEGELSSEAEMADTSDARALYPELFQERMQAGDNSVSDVPASYMDAFSAVMEAQRAESISGDTEDAVPEQKSDEWAEELEGYLNKSREEETVSHSLSDIPLELPEGYVPYTEEAEEDEDDWEEEWDERPKKRSFPRIAAAIALTALPIGLALVLSQTKTLYFADGVTKATAFGAEEYGWEDCRSYEIAPSFFGDRLSFKLTMKDGRTVQLLPDDLRVNEALYEKYESEYDYALAVSASLERAGAKKEVKEKKTIAGGLALREDIGKYVKKLCDMD